MQPALIVFREYQQLKHSAIHLKAAFLQMLKK